MNPPIDTQAVAARIRGLIGGQDQGLIEATARRLGVSEVALRLSVDKLEPHPTLEALDAIVREYGVDPAWLLTGQYDATLHRIALDTEVEFTGSPLSRLLGRRAAPPPRDDAGGGREIKLEA